MSKIIKKRNLFIEIGKDNKGNVLSANLANSGLLIVGEGRVLLESITRKIAKQLAPNVKFIHTQINKDKRFKIVQDSSLFLRPEITSISELILTLDYLVEEMDKRYNCIKIIPSIKKFEIKSKIKIPRIVITMNELSAILELERDTRDYINERFVKLLQFGNRVGIHCVFLESGKSKELGVIPVYINIFAQVIISNSDDEIIYNILGYHPEDVSSWGNTLFARHENEKIIDTRINI